MAVRIEIGWRENYILGGKVTALVAVRIEIDRKRHRIYYAYGSPPLWR